MKKKKTKKSASIIQLPKEIQKILKEEENKKKKQKR
tara:strand:- start:531 stop:638 length:108 start_codon:yes stop_codon:yes gene_type:complete